MLIFLRQELADRACAAIEDTRAITLEASLGLSPAAAWMLAQMETDRNGVDAKDFPHDDAFVKLPFLRQSPLMSRLVKQIHDAIGTDSTLTENGLIRLTPLGRIRIKKSLGELYR